MPVNADVDTDTKRTRGMLNQPAGRKHGIKGISHAPTNKFDVFIVKNMINCHKCGVCACPRAKYRRSTDLKPGSGLKTTATKVYNVDQNKGIEAAKRGRRSTWGKTEHRMTNAIETVSQKQCLVFTNCDALTRSDFICLVKGIPSSSSMRVATSGMTALTHTRMQRWAHQTESRYQFGP